MKKEDFINITDNMFDICEKLISNGGNCKEIDCKDCPFPIINSTNNKPCNKNGYTSHIALKKEKDDTLVQSARKFLGFKNNNEVTFHNAKVGDRVWDFLHKYGIIEKLEENAILVKFNSGVKVTYNLNGSCGYPVDTQTLFWNEIKFEIPEKPFDLEAELRQLEIKDFVSNRENFYLEWDNYTKKIHCEQRYYNQQPFGICFEKESIKSFMDNVKDKNITKEQFFAAYKNVFGAK